MCQKCNVGWTKFNDIKFMIVTTGNGTKLKSLVIQFAGPGNIIIIIIIHSGMKADVQLKSLGIYICNL